MRLSNRTDPDSAKMATGKGVVQGYTAVAAVDARAQIIVDAQAHGTGTEQVLPLPVVAALAPHAIATTVITADAGYHSEANLRALAAQGRPALIADNGMRARDERFATQARHQQGPQPAARQVADAGAPAAVPAPGLRLRSRRAHLRVPRGKVTLSKGKNLVIRGYRGTQFRGAKRDCVPCTHRARCLRTPDRTATRQVMFFDGPAPGRPESYTRQMQRRIDAAEGRAQYGRRFATVEPVFANLRHNKGLAHFTLRGRAKVDGQWTLFCLVHNIEKLAHAGYAA